jgi:hypothetical protein
MNNKIETLRAICFTSEDMVSIKNLGDVFTDKDIEFMVEFKKIYELGVEQLKKFIDKLDEEGSELDTYSILYYVDTLLSGPLSFYVREYLTEKDYTKYFGNISDSMGMLGHKTRTTQNSPIYMDMGYPGGGSIDIFNNVPKFCQTIIEKSIKITEDIFRSSLYSSSFIDNTLPIINKNNSEKYDKEKTGEWAYEPSGTYLNKDVGYFIATTNASDRILEKVKEYLGDENFRLYSDLKSFSPFDSEKNQSTSTNSIVEKEFVDPLDDTKKEIILLDLMGDEFDSKEKRAKILKISGPEKEEEFKLHTNEGQLGN